MKTNINSKLFRPLIVLVTAIIGWLIYRAISIDGLDIAFCELQRHNEAIGEILSGYAFTIAGFLSVVATFLFTLGDKPYFQLYQRRGSFGDLMFLHAVALLVLGLVFVASIVVLACPQYTRLAMAFTLLSMVQLAFLTFISYRLSSRSATS